MQKSSKDIKIIEDRLTEQYGEVRKKVNPGLRWLLGRDHLGYPAYLDHAQYRIRDGKKTIVGRPYDMNPEVIGTIERLAKEKGLRFEVSKPSNYGYGTFLVIITEEGVINTNSGIDGKKATKHKPTLAPWRCSHCNCTWYGWHNSRKTIIPIGVILCHSCYNALDNYMFEQDRDLWQEACHHPEQEDDEWKRDHPQFVVQAKRWVDNTTPKKNTYDATVPKWMRIAIDSGEVMPNSEYVYAITSLEDGTVQVEKNLDRSVLRYFRKY
jgi:hypothetical protein